MAQAYFVKPTKENDEKNGGKSFWIATFATLLLILSYMAYSSGTEDDVMFSQRDALIGYTRDLSYAFTRASKNPSDCGELGLAMAKLGVALETILTHNVACDNAALAFQPDMTRAFQMYRAATLFSSDILRRTLSGRLSIPAMEPPLLWTWVAATTYALTVAEPEFFLAVDDAESHGESLVSGLHLLTLASNALPRAGHFTNGASLVPLAARGESEIWVTFCTRTFSSLGGLEVRRAAILEELIALHTDLGPLRLHYTVALALSPQAAATGTVSARIRHEFAKLHQRTHVDHLHRALSHLMEAYVHGISGPSALQTVQDALLEVGNCEQLLRPFAIPAMGWKKVFPGQERPDVMDRHQASRLLSKLQKILPPGSIPAAFVGCELSF